MVSKSSLNALCIVLLPVLLILSGYWLFSGRFLYSLASLMGVAALMEARVRMGYRSPARRWLFVTHLACSGLLIFALVILATHEHSVFLPYAEAGFIGAALTGIFLVKGSWHRLY